MPLVMPATLLNSASLLLRTASFSHMTNTCRGQTFQQWGCSLTTAQGCSPRCQPGVTTAHSPPSLTHPTPLATLSPLPAHSPYSTLLSPIPPHYPPLTPDPKPSHRSHQGTLRTFSKNASMGATSAPQASSSSPTPTADAPPGAAPRRPCAATSAAWRALSSSHSNSASETTHEASTVFPRTIRVGRPRA